MTDPATLAHEARRALAEAHSATLLVEGLGRVAPHPDYVLLDDADGRPRFTCSPDSPVAAAAAARCPAILDVGVPISSVPGGSVIFAGHLAIAPRGTPSQDALLVVELHLVSVVVEIDDPQSGSLVARQVPLAAYSGRDVPTLAMSAETMRLHTNARHTDRLRACAAARAGIAEADVIEAQLLEVGPGGAELGWLDAEGGHAVRLGFPRAATDGPELAALLRAQLGAHRSSRS